jgi:hypothetical protein
MIDLIFYETQEVHGLDPQVVYVFTCKLFIFVHGVRAVEKGDGSQFKLSTLPPLVVPRVLCMVVIDLHLQKTKVVFLEIGRRNKLHFRFRSQDVTGIVDGRE